MYRTTPAKILSVLLIGMGGLGCGTDTAPGDLSVNPEVPLTLTEPFQQNWSGWPNGQCIVAARAFYLQNPSPAGTAADLGYQPTTCISAGSWWCASQGACHAWLVPTVDGNWNRHSMTDGVLPYDVIVYQDPNGYTGGENTNCPAGVNAHYGHIAAVDHVSNGNIFVMDSNFYGNTLRASSAHTVALTPFGFFRLKSREPPPPSASCSANDSQCNASSTYLTSCNGGGGICTATGPQECCCPTARSCRSGSFPFCCPAGQICGAGNVCVVPAPTCPTGSNWHGAGQYCWFQPGMANTTANHLYNCASAGSAASDWGNCGEGCHGMPAGYNDLCYSAYCPTGGYWYGAGLYCGRAGGMSNANPNIVYYCSSAGAKASINKWCSAACVVAPPGYNDHC